MCIYKLHFLTHSYLNTSNAILPRTYELIYKKIYKKAVPLIIIVSTVRCTI